MHSETEEQIITQAYQMAEDLRNKTRWKPDDPITSREAYELLVQVHELAGQIISAIDAYDGEPEDDADEAEEEAENA